MSTCKELSKFMTASYFIALANERMQENDIDAALRAIDGFRNCYKVLLRMASTFDFEQKLGLESLKRDYERFLELRDSSNDLVSHYDNY